MAVLAVSGTSSKKGDAGLVLGGRLGELPDIHILVPSSRNGRKQAEFLDTKYFDVSNQAATPRNLD